MQTIETLEALEDIYGQPVQRSLDKVADHITPLYARWIEASRFVVISTVGEEGTDASPRGEDGAVVRLIDAKTLWLPDWRGNNRVDTLRNIVRDDRVSLMFFVTGDGNVVRINGRAKVTADPAITDTFEQRGKHPRSVVVITLEEIYFQCSKAIMRSDLWNPENAVGDLPTAGDFLQEQDDGFDGKTYDDGYVEYAKTKMW